MLGCSQAPPATPPGPSTSVRLAEIPAADPKKYEKMVDMRNWRNPYLIVHAEKIGLFDSANNEEHLLKPGEVLEALANLPPSAWPYGRVVAAQEQSVRGNPDQDRAAIRSNRGILSGTLAEEKIVINWVPTA